MSYWFSQQGASKPPLGARVNWGSPLAAGLQFFLPFSEQSGSHIYDAAGRAESPFLIDAPTWGSGTYGPMLNFNGTSNYLENTTFTLPTSAVTLLIVSRSPTSDDTGSAFGNRDSHVGFDTARCQVHLPFSGTIYWDFGGATGSNRTSYTPDSGFWGRWNVMVFVAGNVGSQIWENGAQKASSGTAITRVNANSGFHIGRYGNDGSRQDIQIATLALWDRCLSAEEIFRLSAQPWLPLSAPSAFRRYVVSSNVSGTSVVTAPAPTLTASGTIVNAYTGTSAVTAAAATMAATGTVVNPAAGFGSNFQLLGIG